MAWSGRERGALMYFGRNIFCGMRKSRDSMVINVTNYRHNFLRLLVRIQQSCGLQPCIVTHTERTLYSGFALGLVLKSRRILKNLLPSIEGRKQVGGGFPADIREVHWASIENTLNNAKYLRLV